MATGSAGTPQQRDAHELARTPQANPYRGAMLDPFATSPAAATGKSASTGPAATTSPAAATGPVAAVTKPATAAGLSNSNRPAQPAPPWAATGTPAAATIAGVLGLALSLTMALFGVSLLALLSLQSDFGAPDRSFYQGADSGSMVLALLDFALAGGCAMGGILLIGGRVLGRVSCTVSGWVILCLSAFWYLRGHTNAAVPVTVALAAAAMLLLGYQRSVTRWLGVLLPAQPD